MAGGAEPGHAGAMLEDVLEVADYVLLMSVNPGWGGQKLIHTCSKRRASVSHAARKEVSFPD